MPDENAPLPHGHSAGICVCDAEVPSTRNQGRVRPGASRGLGTVRCRVAFPARPAYALEDPALKDETSFDKTTAALVEIEQRRAYEEKLEAALKVCADPEN